MNILVITGTHEQPFDRLVAAADRLAANGHDVFIQYGYATKPPVTALGAVWVERAELDERCSQADVIITHGGPGSIWDAFGSGKVPIVVPRLRRHGEHVDDHQLAFARHLARHRRVLMVEDTALLEEVVSTYREAAAEHVSPGELAVVNRQRLAEALERWVWSRRRR